MSTDLIRPEGGAFLGGGGLLKIDRQAAHLPVRNDSSLTKEKIRKKQRANYPQYSGVPPYHNE